MIIHITDDLIDNCKGGDALHCPAAKAAQNATGLNAAVGQTSMVLHAGSWPDITYHDYDRWTSYGRNPRTRPAPTTFELGGRL